jgi:hypothetical protein
MGVSTIAVQVPEPLYRRLERTAAMTHRSVSDVLATTIEVVLPSTPDLPVALADELAGMLWLSDEALQEAIEPAFTREQQQRMAELNDLEDDRPLTSEEQEERQALLSEYERSLLRRAQAFAILGQRGHPLPAYHELRPAI